MKKDLKNNIPKLCFLPPSIAMELSMCAPSSWTSYSRRMMPYEGSMDFMKKARSGPGMLALLTMLLVPRVKMINRRAVAQRSLSHSAQAPEPATSARHGRWSARVWLRRLRRRTGPNVFHLAGLSVVGSAVVGWKDIQATRNGDTFRHQTCLAAKRGFASGALDGWPFDWRSGRVVINPVEDHECLSCKNFILSSRVGIRALKLERLSRNCQKSHDLTIAH